MGAHALRYEPTTPTLTLVDNIECGETIVAKAQQVQAQILELPVAPVKQVRTRSRATRKAPAHRNGPVETRVIKPHPLATERAHELMREHGYLHIKIISETELLVVNTLAPVRRGRR